MHSQTALCSSEPLIYSSLKKSLLGLAQLYHFGAEPFETEDFIPELEVFMEFQHQVIGYPQGEGIPFEVFCFPNFKRVYLYGIRSEIV